MTLNFYRQQKTILLYFIGLFFLLLVSGNSSAQQTIDRNELLTALIGKKTVQKVDIREINFKPSQKTGYHQHPCPVVGYIVSGSVLFQSGKDSSIVLKAGDAFYEPANVTTFHFDNPSDTESLKFIAFYLLNNEKELIKMLSQKN